MARAAFLTAVRGRAMMPTGAFTKRVLTVVVAVPTLAWVVAGAPPWLFATLVIVMAAAATHEVSALVARAGYRTLGPLAMGAGALVTAGFLFRGGPGLALVLAAILALTAPLWRRDTLSVEPAATTLLAVVYVDWMLGHAIWLHGLPGGAALVLLLLGTTWMGETAAYLVGSAVGRHRLAPVISPNKTVEGAVAQVIASVGTALALGAWLAPGWSAWASAGGGALVGVVGQVGDLAESVVKRCAKVKDASSLIPGHGGLLDRLDSLLFNVPIFFYYVTWLGARP